MNKEILGYLNSLLAVVFVTCGLAIFGVTQDVILVSSSFYVVGFLVGYITKHLDGKIEKCN